MKYFKKIKMKEKTLCSIANSRRVQVMTNLLYNGYIMERQSSKKNQALGTVINSCNLISNNAVVIIDSNENSQRSLLKNYAKLCAPFR